MTENFYVPYDQIKFFTLKEGGTYRHGLAFRLYLYLCHYNSGRIRWDERKQLVQKFNSSHTAVHKALAYLQEIGFVKLNNKWISAIGHDKTREITKTKVGRNFNIEFSFDLKLLFDRVKFTNHLFLCLFQTSAMVRGKKIERLVPQAKLDSDSVMLKGGLEINYSLGSSVIQNGFIQKQSSSYQAKMSDRHLQTLFNRNKKISQEINSSNPKRVKYIQRRHRQGLTVDGFYPKMKSELIVSKDRSVVERQLEILKGVDPKLKSCFVIQGRHGGFIITKQPSTEYSYWIESNSNNKKFGFSFEKVEPSLVQDVKVKKVKVSNFKPVEVFDKQFEFSLPEDFELPF